MKRWVYIYLVPGAVLQSVMVGGGYGTGREVVEFFSRYGLLGGLAGIAIATASIAVVFALSLELARAHGAYDYRSFFRVMLGPFWVLYEVLLIALILLVLAVIGAAAGGLLETELGLPSALGVTLVLAMVVALTFFGRQWVTGVLAWWSIALYLVFGAYFVSVINASPDAIGAELARGEISKGWFVASLEYVFYNITAVPVILFAARAIEDRRQALVAGSVGAVIAVVPALLLHLSFATAYPEILEAELPVYAMLGRLGSAVLTAAYLVVLFGTFIETGIGDVQGILERLDGWRLEVSAKALAPKVRALVAGGLMLLAGALSSIGVIDLIAEGYATLSWGFFFVYVLPLLTIGLWRIARG